MSWTWPTATPYVTDHYNTTRVHPIYGRVIPHTGTDFRAPTGTPILAASAGVVSRSAYDPPRSAGGTGAGNHVRIDHANGVTTRYYHLSARHVSVGQRVSTGQRIGLAGSTGDSSGAHLHFETRVSNIPTNPITFYAARGLRLDTALTVLGESIIKRRPTMFVTRYGRSAYYLCAGDRMVPVSQTTFDKLAEAGIPDVALDNTEVERLRDVLTTETSQTGAVTVDAAAIGRAIATELLGALRA